MSTSCLNTGLSLTSHWHLPQFDFGEFPHHPLELNTPTILNGPASRNAMDLNQVNTEARQLVHLYLSIDQETLESGTCRQQDCMCRSAITHEVQFSTNDQWHVGQKIRHFVFHENFVIPSCQPVWKYVGSK
jgi:hypothetical protein